MILKLFSFGKGSFYHTLGKARKIPALLLPSTWKWVECPGWRCCYGCEMQNSKKSTVMDFNLCSSVRLDILSCSFTLKSYLTNWNLLKTGRLRKIMLSEQSCRSPEKIVLSRHSCKGFIKLSYNNNSTFQLFFFALLIEMYIVCLLQWYIWYFHFIVMSL